MHPRAYVRKDEAAIIKAGKALETNVELELPEKSPIAQQAATKFACDQYHRDRRIKSPRVLLALVRADNRSQRISAHN